LAKCQFRNPDTDIADDQNKISIPDYKEMDFHGDEAC
jgi:hypothetical protein